MGGSNCRTTIVAITGGPQVGLEASPSVSMPSRAGVLSILPNGPDVRVPRCPSAHTQNIEKEYFFKKTN